MKIYTKNYYTKGPEQYTQALKDIRSDLLDIKATLLCHPTPKVKEVKKEKVTVITYSPYGVGSYSFFAEPDFARIEEENIIAGDKLAVIVKFPGYDLHHIIGEDIRALRISNTVLELNGWTVNQIALQHSHGWWLTLDYVEDEARQVKTAIINYVQTNLKKEAYI